MTKSVDTDLLSLAIDDELDARETEVAKVLLLLLLLMQFWSGDFNAK
jgi:hypothetical protein